jgi:3-hydroxy-9,10-secoandrosta-1,3,5(10)-triene-9,17-dione monooxygenase reductase component
MLLAGHGFSVNNLRQEQKDLSNNFAGGWQEEQPPTFRFIPWQAAPRLEGCLASNGCDMHKLLEGGDHWIAVGEVVAIYRARNIKNPLLFYQGRYKELASGLDDAVPVNWDFGW